VDWALAERLGALLLTGLCLLETKAFALLGYHEGMPSDVKSLIQEGAELTDRRWKS
jgi:hypothetical protein